MKLARFITIALLPLLLASARADDKPDLQTILDAWKAREQKVESFDFRWWSKRHESSAPSPPDLTARNNLAPGYAITKPENTSIWRYHFVANAGSRYLFEEFGHDWIPKKADFIPKHTVEQFDGKSFKSFYDKGFFNFPIVDATEDAVRIRYAKSRWPDPIRMAFRPFSLAMAMSDDSKLVIANETEIIENNRVLILSDEYRTIWVDPTKGYLPVRWASASRDFRAEVSYQADEIVGWVPHSWTIRQWGDSETATVTQFAINKAIADSEFELDLSGGAILQNESNRRMTQSIIYPDGTQRELQSTEFNGKNFQDLLKTEPDSK